MPCKTCFIHHREVPQETAAIHLEERCMTSPVRRFLSFAYMDRARRRKFGQNFLDAPTAELIAGDLPAAPGESILEIGPGHGALTEHLLRRGNPLTAVEIDPECVEFLKNKFAGVPDFSVVNADILDFDMDAWIAGHGKPWLTGNLPYNVSTAIVAKLMPLLRKTCGFMGMVQFEVAERFCALPGTRIGRASCRERV